MKKLLCAMLAVLMSLLVCSCGNGAPASEGKPSAAPNPAPEEPAEKPMEISIGHIYAPTHAIGQACDLFVQKVNELSGGSIKAVVYPSSQLGSESEILQQVEQGALDMTIASCWLSLFW